MASMLEPGIFRHPRPKKSLLPPPNKKRKIEHRIDEINFDLTAREDYLTGFHKRKVQRAKQAQAEATKRAREEKIQMRKQLREERKQELDNHVEAVNSLLEYVEGDAGGVDDAYGWKGIQDEQEGLDHEESYVDDDRYTTVIVEAVDVSKEGLTKSMDSYNEESETDIIPPKEDQHEQTGKKKWPKKPRKKTFRYESKVERKLTRAKQKAGKKARADSRRGND